MRIADNMTFDQVRGNLTKNRSEMADLQNQAATQKRVTKPSDDPVAAARVLASRVDLAGNKQFSKNLSYAKSFLEFTDQSLAEVTENLMRMKELAISQANDASANDESRRVVATEVQQIYSQMVAISNRKLGDRYIFGGYRTTQQPFDVHGNYKGDDGEMMIHTDKGSFIAMNLPGDQVFNGVGLGRDGVVQASSKQAVTIEEFMVQQQEKSEEQQEKANQLREREERALQLRGPANTSPGEGSNESQRPPEPEEVGVNLFAVIKRFDGALRTNDKEVIQDLLNEIDSALSQVVMARAQVGSRSMSLDNALQTLQKVTVDNQVLISEMEDADIYKTVSDINKTESTLQATLQTSGKIMQPSLLDFLR